MQEPWPEVEVFRSARGADARERALVLRARGIPFRAARDRGGEALFVDPANAELALAELAAYEAENRGWPPPEGAPQLLTRGSRAALIWSGVLFAAFSIEREGLGGLPWREAGRSQFEAVRSGEWWRGVTALTLHVDLMHLLSNAVFGSLVIVLLAQLVGTGVALGLLTLAGAVGNLLSAYLRSGGFASVGASTAVFAGIGVLVALGWMRMRGGRRSWLQRWAPIIMGLVFLGYLGTSGERTDVLAHATGWISGFCIGLGLPLPSAERYGRRRLQLAVGAGAAALVAGAWAVAFLTA